MMDKGTVGNMQSFIQSKYDKLVYPVAFIISICHDERSHECKKLKIWVSFLVRTAFPRRQCRVRFLEPSRHLLKGEPRVSSSKTMRSGIHLALMELYLTMRIIISLRLN
jgi:hypothetical protein